MEEKLNMQNSNSYHLKIRIYSYKLVVFKSTLIKKNDDPSTYYI